MTARALAGGLLLVLLLSLPTAVRGQLSAASSLVFGVGVLNSFDSPAVGSYQYSPPLTVLQPWSWSNGGIGAAGGPFDPPYPGTLDDAPPTPNQYAFIQTSPNNVAGMRVSNMTAALTGMTSGTSYNISFWYAARSEGYTGNATQSQMTVTVGSVQVWQSPAAILDLSGWTFAWGVFTAPAASAALMFNVVSTSDNDHSVDVDTVLVMPTATGTPLSGAITPTSYASLSFEAPVLNTSYYGPGLSLQSYAYNPLITSLQTWAWTPLQGGVAFTGSPWDPPAPVTPPQGAQYAFIQVSPRNALQDQSSNMSTLLTGLTSGTAYSINFFWATRSGYGQTSQLTIWANGAVVWQSLSTLADTSGGWLNNNTNSFTASGPTASLLFQVQSLTNSDGAILIDAITIGPPFVLPVGYLTVGTPASGFCNGFFEAPAVGYTYNPTQTALQPWVWPANLGGLAASGSPWDPPYPGTPNDSPPSPNQYAFLQTSPNNAPGMQVTNMTATLAGLIGGQSYTLTFWYASRGSGYNNTQSTMTLYLAGTAVWQSPVNISDLSGWTFVSTTFTANAAALTLMFGVVSTSNGDHAVLVDSVYVAPTLAPPPTSGSVTPPIGAPLSFESPSLNPTVYGAPTNGLQYYIYNPLITPNQPWTFTPSQGGIGISGCAWDPPPPTAPPQGVQYAFLQVSPHSALGDASSNMSTSISGLSFGYPYAISFFYGTRNGYGQTSSLTVWVNGVSVYQSAQNLADSAGWQAASTSTFFVPAAGTATLLFQVQSLSNSDGAILIDAVSVFSPPTALPLYNITVGSPFGFFESPTGISYIYNPPLSVLQPWLWTVPQGGVGTAGSPWDPPYPNTPNDDSPSPNQYAFIQTSPNNAVGMRVSNMTTGLVGLTAGTSYTVSFWYAARGSGYQATQSQLTLFISGVQVWQSTGNILDQSGWVAVSQSFTASAASLVLLFNVVSQSDSDHAVLVDTVLVTPTLSPPLTIGSVSPTASAQLSFEMPTLNGSLYGAGLTLQSYAYNPLISSLQPWAWTAYQGGVAITGSPWDPPAPIAPPDGVQYAFLQTSPHNALQDQRTSMSTTVTGLTAGSSYGVSFYWATRAGYATTSQLSVLANGAAVYISVFNLTDAAGWQPATSAFSFAATAQTTLQFQVVSLTNSDGAVLIDKVSIVSSSAPPAPPPSSTGPAATAASSSSAPLTAAVQPSSAAAMASSMGLSSTAGCTCPSNSCSSSSSGLSGGSIAGIVIGSVVGAALLCCLLILCLRAERGGKSGTDTNSAGKFKTVDEPEVSQVSQAETTTGVEMGTR